ncbi:hypothetical protein Tco_0855777, partial [Tanacetum coccineum]
MTTLKFADTHNMVAFLAKPAKSDGFEQIVDFLNAHTIKYALTINPTIYTSCIEQFWATVKAKTFNGEVQLQALVDGKKIIITESIVRRDLQLEDAEGVDCLPNATIFEQFTLMGYEKISQKLTFYKAFFSQQWKFLIHTILQCLSAQTTAWNEFSSTIASAIICLATNQKFNFSKYIFESMLKNLENMSGKFLMYPRFVQVFLDKQLEGMSNHNRIYVTPSHTKKIFGNMRKVGKGFSGRVTPLFPTMVVQNQEELGEGSVIPTDPQHTPTSIQPSPQTKKTQKPRKPRRKDTQVPQPSGPTDRVSDEAVYKELDDSLVMSAGSENVSKLSNDLLLARGNTLRSGEDSLKLQKLMALCTTLQSRVLALETTKTTQANEIDSLKRRVKKLERRNKSRTHELKRLYKGRIADIDADARINLVSTHFDADTDMFGVHDLDGDEVLAEPEVTIKDVNLSVDEVTLAQALASLKSAKVQEKGNVIKETSVPVSVAHALTKISTATTTTATIPTPRKGIVIQEIDTTTTPTTTIHVPKPPHDKGKGIMVEEPVVEQVKPIKRLEQIRLDEELAFKLQAEEEDVTFRIQ